MHFKETAQKIYSIYNIKGKGYLHYYIKETFHCSYFIVEYLPQAYSSLQTLQWCQDRLHPPSYRVPILQVTCSQHLVQIVYTSTKM